MQIQLVSQIYDGMSASELTFPDDTGSFTIRIL
jgi:hypothetical protein